ncbi:MAG: cytochrome c-type biogenesis protein CcmH [Rhodobacteraceae bacterium]|nr:cytochrome c-type biogenesis protein CcmH [Paracoccaceae bacterium]
MRKLMILLLILATPLFAVQPDEILDDPALEARARSISKELRCLVCRNENIDESNAGLARDLRLLVRERLVAGDTDDQTIQYVVDRYGEYVLLKPSFGNNMLLWFAGPILLLMGAGVAVVFVRRKPEAVITELSDAEQKRLSKLLDD